MNHLFKSVFFTFFILLSFQVTCVADESEIKVPQDRASQLSEPNPGHSHTDWEADKDGFRVYSPLEGKQYTVAPPLTIQVPERVDIQYVVSVCHDPAERKQCKQYERLITGASLQCKSQETNCRYEAGLDIPMTANRRYILIVRPPPLQYDPVIIEFDFSRISKSVEINKSVKMKQQ